MNILHLSDLHYSSGEDYNFQIVIEALLDDIKLLKSSNGEIDLVIFSGDLVFNADSNEDFKKAKETFIDKVLKQCNLSYNNFIIVPGNHDIQRSKIDKYVEYGYNNLLDSRDKVNELLQNHSQLNLAIKRLENYAKFQILFNSDSIKKRDNLKTTYQFTYGTFSIGVVALNSSWRAQGGNADYGNLLIGEHQFLDAISEIKNCSLRIGVVHHPLEWLKEFDRRQIRQEIFENLNLLLVGHNHEQQSLNLSLSPSQSFILCNGGCLYQSRDYFNGYALISYNQTSSQISITHRSYYSDRKKFDKALNYNSGEPVTFELNRSPQVTQNQQIETYEKAQYSFLQNINQKLLIHSLDTIAPKDIKHIFTVPRLEEIGSEIEDLESKISSNNKPPKTIELTELISDNTNYFISGQKECGKTTLLNYISLKLFESISLSQLRIPFIINFSSLNKSKNSFLKALTSYSLENNFEFTKEISKHLEQGECCIMIDDYDPEAKDVCELVNYLVSSYPLNKYIISNASKPVSNFLLKKEGLLLKSFKKISIKAFSKASIVKFSKNWFSNSEVDHTEIAEKVIDALNRIHLPKTPVILSFIFWIFEKQGSYVPLNKASVVEKFIEVILEKLAPTKDTKLPDYRIKEHYLAYLAERFINHNEDKISRLDLEKMTIEYFERKKINYSSSKFIDYFIEKGILYIYEDHILFKLKCFKEFFVAKQIIEENDFREKILSAEKSLDFINEIDYATGLERNNVEILNVVYKKTNQIFKEFESEFFHVDLNLFDSLNLELEDAPEQIVDAKKLLKSIKKAKDFASKKDEDFDNIVDEDDDEAEKKELKKFSNKIEKGIMANLFLNLLLLSTVIKNSELIDYSIRKPILDDCFEYWGKFFIIQMIILSEEFKNSEQIKTHVKKKSEEIMPEVSDKVNEALENEKNKEQIDSLNRNIKYFGAIMVEKTFFDFTGTLNLEFYLKEKIKNSNNSPSVIKLLSIFLYGELRLPRFMDLLKDYLKNITKSNRGFMMLIYHNIYNYYISRTKLDESQKKELEKIIVETYLSANRISTNRKGATIDTSKLYDQIRKDRIRTDLSNLI